MRESLKLSLAALVVVLLGALPWPPRRVESAGW